VREYQTDIGPADYRLLKHAHGERILCLVDIRNLGEQAEQERRSGTTITVPISTTP
jgi:hypothetical protein